MKTKSISLLITLIAAMLITMFGCSREEQPSAKCSTSSAGKILHNHKENLVRNLISNTNNIDTVPLQDIHNKSVTVDNRFIENILNKFKAELAIATGESDEFDVLKIPLEELTEVHLQLLSKELCDNPTRSNKYFKFLYETAIPSKIDGLTAAKIAENILALVKKMPNCDASNFLMYDVVLYTRSFSESEARKLAFDILEREDKIKPNTGGGGCYIQILLSYAVEDKYDTSDEFVNNQLKSNSISPDNAFNLRYWSVMSRLIDRSNMERYLEGIYRLKNLSEDDQLRKEDREYCKAIFQTMTESPIIYNLTKDIHPK
ncbi:MAG: hypothetical protein DRI74_08550 [Bacteroidetes bacterium]|nr:MAG: hypothetical protein DRI74_08550 [Bacteroidota bacterium]